MAHALVIPRCAVCGAPLPPPAGTGAGRPRLYCSHRCRQAASRARRQAWAPTASAEAPPPEACLVAEARTASTDEQTAAAVLEAVALAGSLRRLGREARPQLACRCELLADALDAALAEHFGECL